MGHFRDINDNSATDNVYYDNADIMAKDTFTWNRNLRVLWSGSWAEFGDLGFVRVARQNPPLHPALS